MRKAILAILALILASLACAAHVAQSNSTPVPVSRTPERFDTGTPETATKEAVTPTATLASIETATAIVTALEALHVRVRPGEQNAVLGYLYHDDLVTLTGNCQTGWAQITWKDRPAWVNASYLSKNKCQTK